MNNDYAVGIYTAVNKEKGGNHSLRLPPLVYRKTPEFSPKISMYGLTCRRC